MMYESSRVSLLVRTLFGTTPDRARSPKCRNANELAQRSTHQGVVGRVRQSRSDEGLWVSSTTSHIVALDAGDVRACRRVSELLLQDHRIHLQQVRLRESAHLEGRLYLMPPSHHTDRHVARLSESLVDIWDRVGLWS